MDDEPLSVPVECTVEECDKAFWYTPGDVDGEFVAESKLRQHQREEHDLEEDDVPRI